MRKIYISFLCLFFIFAINTKLDAQAVGTYVFAPSAGTYTSLTGATASTAAGDDGTQGGIALPEFVRGNSFRFGKKKYLSTLKSGRDYQNISTNLKLCL